MGLFSFLGDIANAALDSVNQALDAVNQSLETTNSNQHEQHTQTVSETYKSDEAKQNASIFEDESKINDPEFQFYIAARYEDGDGVEKNKKEAYKWYLKSADNGYLPAQCLIANIHITGDTEFGIQTDISTGLKYLLKAYEGNRNELDPDIIFTIGLCYINGYGTQKDLAKGVEFLREAAKKGSVGATEELKNYEDTAITEQTDNDEYIVLGENDYLDYRKYRRMDTLKIRLVGKRYNESFELSEFLKGYDVKELYLDMYDSEWGYDPDFSWNGTNPLVFLKLPKSINKIKYKQFKNCINLESLEIPDRVTEIDMCAFENCHKLHSVKLPSNLKSIGYGSFKNHTGLKTITLHKNITEISEYAFKDCENLESIKLPNTLTAIKQDAFRNCKKLKSITIPNSVTEISEYAFEGCESLESIKLPETPINIASGAFQNCKKLKSITIPKSVTFTFTFDNGYQYAADDVFSGCTNLEEVNIFAKYIPPDFFKDSKKLKTVNLNVGVKGIGSGAFSSDVLEEITIPSSVREIDPHAFDVCSNLKTVIVNCVIPPKIHSEYCDDVDIFYDCDSLENIYVPAESVERYKSEHWATEYNDHLIKAIDNHN